MFGAALLAPLVWLGNPAIALFVGMVLTLILKRPLLAGGQRWGRLALQSAIVLLGFTLTVSRVAQVSADSLALVASYVLIVLAIGAALGRALKVESVSAWLMAAGTAICGGTAIATLAPILKARADQVGVAIGIVFLLNAAAIFGLPLLGKTMALTQDQFGLWVALAVHDTSSVLATAAIYGEDALEVATTVKLGRTLWLIPLALAAGLYVGESKARLRVPGFILAFLGAATFASVVDLPGLVVATAGRLSKGLLVAALFFIGSEITWQTLRQIRGRVLIHAVLLWLAALAATLGAVLAWY
ncbi:MAG: putative sulfate exporter family transporter [Gammaproteobacteria bacterium]|nr:putative sulfate exporter family transporter [Gammaproteobacteria bacterium]